VLGATKFHTHKISEVIGLQSTLDSKSVNSLLSDVKILPGNLMKVTTNSENNTIILDVSGSFINSFDELTNNPFKQTSSNVLISKRLDVSGIISTKAISIIDQLTVAPTTIVQDPSGVLGSGLLDPNTSMYIDFASVKGVKSTEEFTSFIEGSIVPSRGHGLTSSYNWKAFKAVDEVLYPDENGEMVDPSQFTTMREGDALNIVHIDFIDNSGNIVDVDMAVITLDNYYNKSVNNVLHMGTYVPHAKLFAIRFKYQYDQIMGRAGLKEKVYDVMYTTVLNKDCLLGEKTFLVKAIIYHDIYLYDIELQDDYGKPYTGYSTNASINTRQNAYYKKIQGTQTLQAMQGNLLYPCIKSVIWYNSTNDYSVTNAVYSTSLGWGNPNPDLASIIGNEMEWLKLLYVITFRYIRYYDIYSYDPDPVINWNNPTVANRILHPDNISLRFIEKNSGYQKWSSVKHDVEIRFKPTAFTYDELVANQII
jgi:hypothetical protein